MLTSYVIKTVYRTAIATCILIASPVFTGASSVRGQTWGGLYDMDKFLREAHPFSDRQPLTIFSSSTSGKQQPIIAPNQRPNKLSGPQKIKASQELKAKTLFSEVRTGLLLHDTGPFSASDEGGIDINLEFLFSSPSFLSMLWTPRPHFGISYSSTGDTSQGYLGLTWDWSFWRNWFVEISLGGMVHDGHLVGVDGESKSLGCRTLFRESANAGYRLNKNHSIMLHFDHSSNASLCEKNTRDGTAEGRHDVILNEGLENIGIRYGYKF